MARAVRLLTSAAPFVCRRPAIRAYVSTATTQPAPVRVVPKAKAAMAAPAVMMPGKPAARTVTVARITAATGPAVMPTQPVSAAQRAVRLVRCVAAPAAVNRAKFVWLVRAAQAPGRATATRSAVPRAQPVSVIQRAAQPATSASTAPPERRLAAPRLKRVSMERAVQLLKRASVLILAATRVIPASMAQHAARLVKHVAILAAPRLKPVSMVRRAAHPLKPAPTLAATGARYAETMAPAVSQTTIPVARATPSVVQGSATTRP